MDEEVNDAYVEHLLVLDTRTSFIQSLVEEYEQNSKGAQPSKRINKPAAVLDVEPKLQAITQKACSKVKQFMLLKIGDMRKRGANIALMKQHVLLRYKFFQEFLERHSVESALEVRLAYADCMSRFYCESFKEYIVQLQRLEQKTVGKNDLIVQQAQSVLNTLTFGMFGASSPSKKQRSGKQFNTV